MDELRDVYVPVPTWLADFYQWSQGEVQQIILLIIFVTVMMLGGVAVFRLLVEWDKRDNDRFS